MAVQRQWDAATKRLTLGAIGTPVVATLELRTRTSPDDPWPAMPTSTITGRMGWFAPIQDPTDDLLYQVIARDGRGVAGEAVEDSWARGAEGPKGDKGDKGDPGAPAEAQYSGPAPGQNIATVFNPALHLYARWRRAGEPWPTEWARIVGEEGEAGEDGIYTDYRFRASATQPTSPAAVPNPSGWVGTPPTVPAGQYLWMIAARKDSRTHELLPGESWSSPPVRMTQPGQLLPIAHIEVEPGTPPAGMIQFRITGTDWEGGTSGLQYQYAYHFADSPFTGWVGPSPGQWFSLPAAGVVRTEDHHPGRDTRFGVRVRDSAGRISIDTWYPVPASKPGIDPGTGLIDGSRPVGGAHDPDLPPPVAMMSLDSLLWQGIEPPQNLLPAGSGAAVDVPTGATRYPGATAATRDIPLSALGLAVDDVVSYSVSRRVTGAGGVARSGVGWVDSLGEVIRYDNVPDYSGTAEERGVVEGVQIPPGTVAARPYFGERGTGTAHFRLPMFRRGPIASTFEEPPFRYSRDRHLPPNTTVDGDLWVPETARPLIGNEDDPGTIAKTVRVLAMYMIPRDSAQSWMVEGDSYVRPNSAGSTLTLHGAITIPVGATITEVRVRIRRGTNVQDDGRFWFYRVTASGGASTLVSGAAAHTGAWQTIAVPLNEEVTGEFGYSWHIQLGGGPVATTCGVLWLDVEYEVGDYAVSV